VIPPIAIFVSNDFLFIPLSFYFFSSSSLLLLGGSSPSPLLLGGSSSLFISATGIGIFSSVSIGISKISLVLLTISSDIFIISLLIFY
jgi:hypothetical protein